MHHKRKRARNARAGCKLCKPWKDNGVGGLNTIAEALRPLGDLSSINILVGANDWVYVAAKDGSITALGDAVDKDVSSPNGVPRMSRGSNQVYFIGARNNRWTMEALDWTSGAETFHWTIGGQAWNSTFSG